MQSADTEMIEISSGEFYRSPELCAEIARGKRPVGYDPNKSSFDSLLVAFHAHQGPFNIIRFRPPASTGGTNSDFMVRLATLKRAIADGDVFLKRLLQNIGHEPGDLDRAMAHWRAEILQKARNTELVPKTSVTITALEA